LRPRYEHVEIELADEIEVLDVSGTVARLESGGDPFTLIQVDGVTGEQEAVGFAVQRKAVAPAVCPGVRITSKIVGKLMTAGEGLAHAGPLGRRRAFLLVAEERSVDPRGEHGLEPVVQVLTRDPADVSDRRSIGVEPRDALEEQVALLSLQEKGSDVERGSERERLWSRWIQARDFGIRLEWLFHR
jgi:hypothetical protein